MKEEYEDKKEEGGESYFYAKEITQHEDVVMKVAAHYMADEIFSFFNIEGKIVSEAPTELIYLELKKMFQDFTYLMSDGSIVHFEFQSSNCSIEDLRRFRAYEAVMSFKYNAVVRTYVFYSGKINNPLTEIHEGFNTYRVIPIILQDYDADQYLEEIKQKMRNKEVLDKEDFVRIALCPVMGGKSSILERIRKAFSILRDMEQIADDKIQKIEAMLYIMADKFLNKNEMNIIKEEIRMTTLGMMLVEDGWKEGRQAGRQEGRQEGIKALISACKELDIKWDYVRNIISEHFSETKEKAEEYLEKYW